MRYDNLAANPIEPTRLYGWARTLPSIEFLPVKENTVKIHLQ